MLLALKPNEVTVLLVNQEVGQQRSMIYKGAVAKELQSCYGSFFPQSREIVGEADPFSLATGQVKRAKIKGGNGGIVGRKLD